MPMHPGERALCELFTTIRHSLQKPDQTSVRYQSDPKYPGRTIVTIMGVTRDAVQAEIDRALRYVEDSDHGGSATFLNPGRLIQGGYQSRGEVILFGEDGSAS